MGGIFGGHRARRAGAEADAVRAIERNAESEKAGTENEATHTKKRPHPFSFTENKLTFDRREQSIYSGVPELWPDGVSRPIVPPS